MQRGVIRLAARSNGVFGLSRMLRAPNTPTAAAAAKTATPASAAAVGKDFKMQPMQTHPRSSHLYSASAKGAEVGARNEAAFMNYERFTPHDLKGIFAMPHLINLLTVTPLYCAVVCIGSAAWGIFYWDMYCRRAYETVLVARPEELD
ncbi:succinate dehydrogenase subunit [Trypanosoma theileri]|uniref:Succinate dehydrogenase subunit n=1 Tax=Trypanosoma theileri TaxID=67003 RepID=A0A1X0NKT0_9TRYP|nr:succinate dehydrogenase subunit [Trypanosoma theileri]ORC85118.1 succinate dehydrogenase subunit [Trypanosoma theileri]